MVYEINTKTDAFTHFSGNLSHFASPKNSKPNLSKYAHFSNNHASHTQSEPLHFVPESIQLLLHPKQKPF
jgi:hypothetical protein